MHVTTSKSANNWLLILLYIHDKLYIHIYKQKHIQHKKDEQRHTSLEKYASHFIWNGSKRLLKVLLCERCVGGWTELEHIDPDSYGHNSVLFLFSCAAQPGAWGPNFSRCWFSVPHFISNCLTSYLHLDYIIVRRPPSCWRHKSRSFNPSTVKVISWYSLPGCTCYLHRCISFFDSLAGVNMLQYYIFTITIRLNFLKPFNCIKNELRLI